MFSFSYNVAFLIGIGAWLGKCQEPKISNECITTPHICPNKYVTFWLYTKDTQMTPHQLDMSDLSTIKNANFKLGRKLIYLSHGYTGNKDFAPNDDIRPAYFENGEYNIISVDYGPLCKEPCYLNAVLNLKVVANCSAQLLDYLIELEIVPLKDIHLIGFSLGGQLVGLIANYIKSGKLPRITALDPAKPLFMGVPKKKRVDAGDADFVQCVHTDGLQRGLLAPCGHVDFYMNGGLDQPGCKEQTKIPAGECNHNRAPMYYAESINSNLGIWGYKCAQWYFYALGMCTDKSDVAIMGMKTPKSTRGTYIAPTNDKSPFSKGLQFPNDEYMNNFIF